MKGEEEGGRKRGSVSICVKHAATQTPLAVSLSHTLFSITHITLSQTHTQRPTPHLERSHKLDGADQRQVVSGGEVELDRVQEVGIVHLDVHEHVQHLNARGGIYGDCREGRERERER